MRSWLPHNKPRWVIILLVHGTHMLAGAQRG
jgi:hypothetical protein